MLLMAAVVQIEDEPALSAKLVELGLRLTKINSTGGLFGADSVAILMGLDDARLDDVIAAIVETCHTRHVHMSSVAMLDPTFLYLTPMEVEVGGAVVFCVPVERDVHIPEIQPAQPAMSGIPTGPTPGDQTESTPMTSEAVESIPAPLVGEETGGDEAMKLIVAIVKGDDADEVIRALLTAGHRLTRINTTGGFLRRGNATLLIGVKANQVDEILNLIQAACPRRAAPAPLEKGLPEYSANVFVLDASHFIRV